MGLPETGTTIVVAMMAIIDHWFVIHSLGAIDLGEDDIVIKHSNKIMTITLPIIVVLVALAASHPLCGLTAWMTHPQNHTATPFLDTSYYIKTKTQGNSV